MTDKNTTDTSSAENELSKASDPISTDPVTSGDSASPSESKRESESKNGSDVSDAPKVTASSETSPEKITIQKSEASNDKSDSVQTTTKQTPTSTKKTAKQSITSAQPVSVSKTAIVALVISLGAVTASGYLFWANSQQQQLLEQKLSTQNKNQLQKNSQQFQQKLKSQNNALTKQLSQAKQNLNQQLKQFTREQKQAEHRIQYLEKTISRLSQNKPSDWLLHEAEYLIRIAVRTIWLEQDTQAAISLLQDADLRLSELNHPQLLPVRQLIHDDINALKLMPRLDIETIVLTLSSLEKQIPQLSLAMVQIPDATQQQDSFELSDDHNDWRENLSKTWKKLMGDFITVRRRTGNVEPLMSPQHQQNLRENLTLKLQKAQWAAREQKADIYQQSLSDINTWLSDYFDMTVLENKEFFQAVEQLKTTQVSFNYPNTLASLDAIRSQISLLAMPEPSEDTTAEPAAKSAQGNKPGKSTSTSTNNQSKNDEVNE